MAGAGLVGRVVLLVGGSRGLGRAIALGAARRGARLAVVARSKPDLDVLRAEITAAGGAAPLVVAADARDGAALEAAVHATVDALGTIDAGVYNAGVGPWEAVLDMPETRWDETMDVNAGGAFRFTRALLPVLIHRRGGQLVYVCSRLAAEPLPRYAAYAASKAALRVLADVVAKEAGGHGVRVTTILPGLIDTGFSDAPHGRPREDRPPHDLMLSADEVADEVLHVLETSANVWIKELLVYPARLAPPPISAESQP